ncbi:MAG: hypothetical protein IH870_05605 [Chloroflexi bacterium]|nr:hypothetical protein [Chloroflexota bacterium]
MGFLFLKRLLGTTEQAQEENDRFKRNLRKLEDREKELEALSQQLDEVSAQSEKKQECLSTTHLDLAETMSKTISFPPTLDEADEQEDKERSSGEYSPIST